LTLCNTQKAFHVRTDLDELRSLAIARAKQTGDLTDLEKAATISKAIAEERKATTELSNADRSFRLTRLQSLLAGMLTIISVLGLTATSVYNIAQLENTRNQTETTEWRELLTSIQKSNEKPNGIVDDITIPLRLRSFASSVKYKNEARTMAAVVMGKMADPEGFNQLFDFIFTESGIQDLDTMILIAREQAQSSKRIDATCKSESERVNFGSFGIQNVCWAGYTEKQLLSFGLTENDKAMFELKRKYNAIGVQISFISPKIAEHLRRENPVKRQIPLRGLYLFSVDLSKVDFHNIDISYTFFDSVNFSRAILQPNGHDGALFSASNWWDAEIADPKLLNILLSYFYPRRSESFNSYIVKRPTRQQYTKSVLDLCVRSNMTCNEADLIFEEIGNESGVQ
jgi:hypothetical protein